MDPLPRPDLPHAPSSPSIAAALNARDTVPRGCLLVVEDSGPLLILIREMLEMHFPHRILGCSTGQDAVELARRYRPAAVVLDLVLPDTDGESVCRALLKHEETAAIPVVLMSGTQPDLERMQCANLTGFLAKPFQMAALVQTVQAAL